MRKHKIGNNVGKHEIACLKDTWIIALANLLNYSSATLSFLSWHFPREHLNGEQSEVFAVKQLCHAWNSTRKSNAISLSIYGDEKTYSSTSAICFDNSREFTVTDMGHRRFSATLPTYILHTILNNLFQSRSFASLQFQRFPHRGNDPQTFYTSAKSAFDFFLGLFRKTERHCWV